MREARSCTCEICGCEKLDSAGWFLVRSEAQRDRVSVLRWDEHRARDHGMHSVCGAEHARELVARWVFSGTLCCGAQGARWRVEPPGVASGGRPRSLPPCDPPEMDFKRLENAEPETLLAILDAVEVALQDKWQTLEDDEEVLLYDA